jgi:hypothetical protein
VDIKDTHTHTQNKTRLKTLLKIFRLFSMFFRVFRFSSLIKGQVFYRFEEPTTAALLASNSSSVTVPEPRSFLKNDECEYIYKHVHIVAINVSLIENRSCDRMKNWNGCLIYLTLLFQKDFKNQKKTLFSSAKS